MFRKRKLNGRESIVAAAALESMNEREGREAAPPGMAALAALAPGMRSWRETRRGVIRLIDLERRARFARPLTDAT
ncbi:hypothetical protein V3H18_07145 [Methylocystis sp. 9N]|uniref:Uncharacterized protein n=1 Tax=Methylocystis borbori TaxID=3118750 RepID=A0ABU7XFZ6_9HYPH